MSMIVYAVVYTIIVGNVIGYTMYAGFLSGTPQHLFLWQDFLCHYMSIFLVHILIRRTAFP